MGEVVVEHHQARAHPMAVANRQGVARGLLATCAGSLAGAEPAALAPHSVGPQ